MSKVNKWSTHMSRCLNSLSNNNNKQNIYWWHRQLYTFLNNHLIASTQMYDKVMLMRICVLRTTHLVDVYKYTQAKYIYIYIMTYNAGELARSLYHQLNVIWLKRLLIVYDASRYGPWSMDLHCVFFLTRQWKIDCDFLRLLKTHRPFHKTLVIVCVCYKIFSNIIFKGYPLACWKFKCERNQI